MKTLATLSLPAEAHLLAARLESAGIRVVLRDDTTIQTDWLLSNAIGGIKVEVADEDYEAACEIAALPPTEAGILVCPKCSSGDVYCPPASLRMPRLRRGIRRPRGRRLRWRNLPASARFPRALGFRDRSQSFSLRSRI